MYVGNIPRIILGTASSARSKPSKEAAINAAGVQNHILSAAIDSGKRLLRLTVHPSRHGWHR